MNKRVLMRQYVYMNIYIIPYILSGKLFLIIFFWPKKFNPPAARQSIISIHAAPNLIFQLKAHSLYMLNSYIINIEMLPHNQSQSCIIKPHLSLFKSLKTSAVQALWHRKFSVISKADGI